MAYSYSIGQKAQKQKEKPPVGSNYNEPFYHPVMTKWYFAFTGPHALLYSGML
jgi:hypothetical protein